MPVNPSDNNEKVLIWSFPTRLFHWLLVASITTMIVTGLSDNLDWMEWHQNTGFFLLGLLLFRVLWGFFGTDYGHFRRFPLHPGSFVSYLRGERKAPGHNPLGALSVIAMLIVIASQVISGLMTSDGFYIEGPWVYWVEDDWVDIASSVHDSNWILLSALIGLHIAALIYHRAVKKHHLVKAMVTGRSSEFSPADSEAQGPGVVRLILIMTASVVITWAMLTLPGS